MKSDHQGFTLLEMMIVISLTVILLVSSTKVLMTLWKRWDEAALQTDVLHAFELAVRESSLRHEPIAWCRSQNNQTCTTAAANGQLIGMYQDGVMHVLHVFQEQVHRGHLYFRSFPLYREFIQFQFDGYAQSDNATIWYCPQKALTPAWAIFLNQAARARVVRPDAQGNIVDSHGKLLVCVDVYQQSFQYA